MKRQNTFTNIQNFLTGKPSQPRPMAKLMVDGVLYKSVPYPTNIVLTFPDKETADLFITKIINKKK